MKVPGVNASLYPTLPRLASVGPQIQISQHRFDVVKWRRDDPRSTLGIVCATRDHASRVVTWLTMCLFSRSNKLPPHTAEILKMAPTLTPNPALHVTEDHRIYMDESPTLTPGPNDCVVHVQANGICGYAQV